MGLNKQKGNMYGFITHTWNPVKGKCQHDCTYCFMKRFALKPVRLDAKELKVKLGTDKYIFVCSSTDLFATNVPDVWINQVIAYTNKYSKNTYLWQSKKSYPYVLL